MILRKYWKTTALLGVTSGLGLGVYGYSRVDPGGGRSLDFWKTIGPIYLQYRYLQFLNDDVGWMSDEDAGIRYNDLHNKYTDDVKLITYRLRGFYLKSAQLMSVQDGFIPKQYMTWLKDTQDNVPSEFNNHQEVIEYISRILKDELNTTFDDVFEEFDEIPLGVASIGQVHRARLRGSHQEVAVKIQLPDMERRFRADIATIKMFCQLASPQFLPSFNEIERQFCTGDLPILSHSLSSILPDQCPIEFDYTGEAQNLADIYQLMNQKWNQEVIVPRPHMNLCSKHLLVMDYLPGVKLVDGIRAQYRAIAAQTGDTRDYEVIERERIEAIRSGKIALKTLKEAEKEHELIQWYLFLNNWVLSFNPVRYAYNQTVSPLCQILFGQQSSVSNWKYSFESTGSSPTPLVDLGHTLKVLCDVHASQIFEGGTFNGDPHPGNILLMPDGRLGLIDYGQVKRMTVLERINFAKLMIALYRDDRPEIIRLYRDVMGYQTKLNNEDLIYRHACFYCDRDTDDITMGKNMHLFLEWMQQEDPVVSLPEQYIMASRVTLMMRGMAKAFGLRIRMSEIWKDEAEHFLRSQGVEY